MINGLQFWDVLNYIYVATFYSLGLISCILWRKFVLNIISMFVSSAVSFVRLTSYGARDVGRHGSASWWEWRPLVLAMLAVMAERHGENDVLWCSRCWPSRQCVMVRMTSSGVRYWPSRQCVIVRMTASGARCWPSRQCVMVRMTA